MSQHDGSSISIFTASDDDTDSSPRETPRRRREARRRERHDAHRQLRAAEQTPIRRLMRGTA